MSKLRIMKGEPADGPVVTEYGLQINLRDMRERAGITLEQIAPALKVAPATASRRETGEISIMSRDLPVIARAYGCDISQIFSLPGADAFGNQQIAPIDLARNAEIARLRSELEDLHHKMEAWAKQAQTLLRQFSKVMPRT